MNITDYKVPKNRISDKLPKPVDWEAVQGTCWKVWNISRSAHYIEGIQIDVHLG